MSESAGESSAAPTPDALSPDPLRLLVVEDSEADFELTLERLEREGFFVRWRRVETDDALRDALANPPDGVSWDVVLTDFVLPRFSGPDALRIVRAFDPDLPCLLVTGAMDEETAVRLMREGAADIILKSRTSRLVSAIDRERKEARNRRQKARMERLSRGQTRVLELLAAGGSPDDALGALAQLAAETFAGAAVVALEAVPRPATPAQYTRRGDAALPDPLRAALDRLGAGIAVEGAGDTLRTAGASAGFPATLVRPIHDEAGALLGALVIFHPDRTFAPPLTSSPDTVSLETDALASLVHLAGLTLQRQRRDEALRWAEGRLAAVLAHLPVSVWMTDGEGRLLFAQGRLLKQLGMDSDSLIGRSVYEMTPSTANLPPVAEALRGERTMWETVRGEMRLETYATRVVDDELVRLFAVTVDTTERWQLQQQVLQSAKLAAMGELISGVAHEIGNPLTGIHTLAQALARSSTAERRGDAETIVALSGQIYGLIRSLLDFARRGDTARVDADINTIVRDVLALAQIGWPDREIALELDAVPSLPRVRVRADQIGQVVLNLISNAEYALRERPRSGHPQGRIVVATTFESPDDHLSPGGFVRVSVRDNGSGVPEAIRDRVFESFFTTKPAGEGTGLGLSISRGIAEEHGGSLTLDDTVHDGAAFILRLPVLARSTQ